MPSDNEDLLNLLCREGSIDILRVLSRGKARFSDLKKVVKHTTLAKRLKELEKGELVKRRILSARPPKTEYSITNLGRKALLIVNSLEKLE